MDDLHRQILDFEARPWRSAAAKEVQVREQFGLSATRYYQILGGLLEDPDAEAYAPALVHRLRRLRRARIQARTATAMATVGIRRRLF